MIVVTMAPTASRYIKLGECLLVTATFAGTLTFTTILTVSNLSSHVKTLLGFASALFLASITGVFPLLLVLQRYADEDPPVGGYYCAVTTGLELLASMTLAAFILLVVVLKYYISRAAFVLCATFVGINTALTLLLGLWNLYTVLGKIRKYIKRVRNTRRGRP